MHPQASYYIDKLSLEQHPEGGWFSETYRSPLVLSKQSLAATHQGERAAATAIYFMLQGREQSTFHQLQSDEMWFFQAGSAVECIIYHPDGKLEKRILGGCLHKGEDLQVLFPAHSIFGARLLDTSSYMLCSCVVAPGFDFADFRILPESELAELGIPPIS